MKCNHKKNPLFSAHNLLFCDPCAEKYAGPKPKPIFQVGDLVVSKNDNDIPGLGKVIDVAIVVHGQATTHPSWTEDLIVKFSNLSSPAIGSASFYELYKPASNKNVPDEWVVNFNRLEKARDCLKRQKDRMQLWAEKALASKSMRAKDRYLRLISNEDCREDHKH